MSMTELELYNKKLEVLKADFEADRIRNEALKRKLEFCQKIVETLEGVEKTRKKYRARRDTWGIYSYDPGKYEAAYFYVLEADDEEIIAAKDFKPHQLAVCCKCGEQRPLFVRYEQTEDSPFGDTWEAQVYFICCDYIRNFKRYIDSNRFLLIK